MAAGGDYAGMRAAASLNGVGSRTFRGKSVRSADAADLALRTGLTLDVIVETISAISVPNWNITRACRKRPEPPGRNTTPSRPRQPKQDSTKAA